eukprot:m.231994 g.231994  ORF g.231994 m.231994 type:complete len:494 (+) comp12288_c0_seq1:110-1591(+)
MTLQALAIRPCHCAMMLRVVLVCAVLAACAHGAKKHIIPVIDIGDEYMKVAAVNPRGGDYLLFDIALNEQSERKTSVVVGFEQDGEMRVGEDGVALKVRAPTRCLHGFMELLGAEFSGSVVQQFLVENPQFGDVLVPTARGTVAFKVPGVNDELPVEVLIAYLVRSVVSKFSVGDILLGSDSVSEIALIVPEHFDEVQAGLLKQAAELAGVRVSALVPQLAAAIIDYAVGGQNSGAGAKQTVIGYGMGGLHSAAAAFQIERAGAKNKKKATVVALGPAISERVGAAMFTSAVAGLARASFAAPLDGQFKALAKLTRAAKEAKEQLSSSPQARIQIEALHAGKTLDASITLTRYEEAIDAIATKGVSPVSALLSQDRLTVDDVTVCELFGGGVRVPRVARALQQTLPKLTLGRHINGDEAAVFGAAYLVATRAKLSGLQTELQYVPGPQDSRQQLASPAQPLEKATIEAYKALMAQIDAQEEQRQLAAAADEDL